MIIDTHSHIYSEQFDEDREQMINRAIGNKVDYILMPNVDVESFDLMMKIHHDYPKNCLPMLGLHPTSVNENYIQDLEQLQQNLAKHSFCAIGEIGIDLYWDKTFIKEQVDAFEIQIAWAKEFNLPIVIHARDAFDEVFSALDKVGTKGLSGVFHSFTGTLQQAKKALSYSDFKLSINGVVTFKNSGLDKVVRELNIEDLVLETDAPYLTPTPYRGKRNEPNYVHLVADKVSDLLNISVEEVNRVTSKNAITLFNLNC